MSDDVISRITEIVNRDSAVAVTVRTEDLRALLELVDSAYQRGYEEGHGDGYVEGWDEASERCND